MKQRLIGDDPADLVLTYQVYCGNDFYNAFARFGFAEVNAVQLSMCDRRIKNTCKQRPVDKRDVVQVNGLAANV